MNQPDRLLDLLNSLVAFVVAPAAILSVLLGWPGFVQVALTLLMVVGVSVPLVVPAHTRRRR